MQRPHSAQLAALIVSAPTEIAGDGAVGLGARGLLGVLTKNPARERVHKVDLPTHDAGQGFIRILALRNCFGCLPSRAERFREIIREEFVRMYEEHDVLAEVLAQARKDLGAVTKGLPDKPPPRGSLDIKQVRDADYAFA